MRPRDKIIRYQVHAKRRMKRRGISEQQVERVVRQPDKTGPAKRVGARKYEKKLSSKRRIAVIIEETERELWVISAWCK